MPGPLSYLVVGNGIAGVTAAETLRLEEPAAHLTMVTNDPFPAYYRPTLKAYLGGTVPEDRLWARSPHFYQEQQIRCVVDQAVHIDVDQQRVHLQGGGDLAYDRLLLATGARAARLSCPGANLPEVVTLHTIADYQFLLSRLSTARHVVVVGGGVLSLETAEMLRKRGYQVAHLIRQRVLWREILDATASDLVIQQERRSGVQVHLGTEVAEITGSHGQVSGVTTTSGLHIPCEVVVVAIGIETNSDFIKRSGIACSRGVQVNASMQTNAPSIYAAGDVVESYNSLTLRARLVGQWYPAIQHGRAAAYSMLDRLDIQSQFKIETFYNTANLYGLDFAAVGLSNMHDARLQVFIAPPRQRIYRKIVLHNGMPMGMLTLGTRKDALAFKRAMDYRVNLSPVIPALFAEHFDLESWLDALGVPPLQPGVRKIDGEAASPAAPMIDTGSTYAASI